METIILERAIIKLAGLLLLCFGEEGGDIIGNYIGNAAHDCSVTADIMVPGQKVDALIGYCQVHNFNRFTHVLEDNVLLFVNQVSEIIHLITDEYCGAPNKNLGDSFLLAWRLTAAMDPDTRSKMADLAAMATVSMIATINKAPEIASYREQMAEGDKEFRVNLGIGLHAGWAIEGAIGSDYKIDAAYLSLTVDMAARLQRAAEHYGTSIILSDAVVSRCSAEMARICRLIDQVTTENFREPLRIYTVDLDPSKLVVDSTPAIPVIKNRYKWRQMRETQKATKLKPDFKVWEAFRLDYDVVVMRSPFTNEFFRRFFTAYRNYEAGEWLVARDLLYTCHYEPKYHTPPVHVEQKDWPQDGPTRALLAFMQGYNFEAPPDWAGNRELSYG